MNIHTPKKIAIATYKIQQMFNVGTQYNEDETLLEFLKAKGEDVSLEIWDDPQVDWSTYDWVIIKSTWDYHTKHEVFLDWLTHLETLGVKVKNDAATIRWNSDKIYLKEISESSLPVVASIYPNSFDDIASCFEQFKTEEIVVKPRVSAGANNTFKIHISQLAQHQEQLETLMQTSSFIVQPFVKEIENGEWSFLFFGGIYSHALLKTPKQNDFRVQHYHGGSIEPAALTLDKIEKEVQPFVSQFAPQSLYARVDGVFIDDVFHLMELELIEPYLYLNTFEDAFENYYQAILKLKS